MESYQRITNGSRVLAKGRDRLPDYRLFFPSAPVGKTILDIGCNVGFFPLQAAAEGAKCAVGLDRDRNVIRCAQGHRDTLKLPNAHFYVHDIQSPWRFAHYDVVLCLNVLHHLPEIEDIRRALAWVDACAIERIVVASPIPKDGAPWSRERQHKRRIALGEAFFRQLWPSYDIRVYPTASKPNSRHCIEVRK